MRNLEFRKLMSDDLPFLVEVRNECCEEFLHNSHQYSYYETVEWFENTNPMFWVIMWDDIKIGYFRTSNYSKENRNIYMGADLHKDFRGKGLAYESYMKFIPILGEELNLHKISLEVLETNQRAIKLYERIGFVHEGVKRDEVFKNGKWVDSIIMSMLNEEWTV